MTDTSHVAVTALSCSVPWMDNPSGMSFTLMGGIVVFPVNIKASELVNVELERSVTKMTKILIEINTIVILDTRVLYGRPDGFNP